MTLAPNHGLRYKVVHDPDTTSADDIDETREYVQIVHPETGTTRSITGGDPNYGAVLNALIGQTEHAYTADEVLELVDPSTRVWRLADELGRLSDRITYHDDSWFYDDRPMANALTKHIEKMYLAGGQGWEHYVRFLANLADNPSERSKRHLFHWMEQHDVVVTEDGNLLMWKGVRDDGRSLHAGFAIVDGVAHEHDHIPNQTGSVIEMPRERVDPERNAACSYGLHVGTKAYAEHFAHHNGYVVMCEVNPRDIVSVPTDSDNQKVRTCRYRVTDVSPNTRFGPTFSEADGDYPEGSWLQVWDTYDPEATSDQSGGEEGLTCLFCGDDSDGEDFCSACEEEQVDYEPGASDEGFGQQSFAPPF